MSNKIVIPTGYMGSGSSAVTNLLSEIKGYDINNAEFEYVMLHCPDGLFDLEDKLLNGNNALRSDEAIHRFLNCMRDLYDKKNYWVSGYKKNVSVDFKLYYEEFINSLLDVEFEETYWYYQQNPINLKMKYYNYLRRILGKLSGSRIKIRRPLLYKKMMLAFPETDQFYIKAKKFLDKFYNALGYESHNLVLDQFVLPHNLYRVNNYFDDNVNIIVVDRDPRDVFILNKYVWTPKAVAVPYPLDAEEFCKVYKKVRKSEKLVEDKRILRIHFEDLIYCYKDTLNRIYGFLDIDCGLHKSKENFFNPKVSVKNTQLFKTDPIYLEESRIISYELGNYIYDFPQAEIHREMRDLIF